MTPRVLRAALIPLALLVFVYLAIMFYLAQLSPLPDSREFLYPDAISAARREGRLMQAVYLLEAQAAEQGWTADSLRIAGEVWREMGDLPRALNYWEIAAQQNPNNVALIRTLAQTYLDLQQWTEASDALERLVVLNPKEAWGHLQLGLILAAFDPLAAENHLRSAMRQPAYQQMVIPLLEIVTEYSSDPLISIYVGQALFDMEMWSYAELAFRHAVDVAAPFPEAMAYVGLARDRQGKDGSEWVNQAVALAMDNARVLYVYALHLRHVGDDAGSIDALLQAIALEPDNPALYAELGTSYRLIGDMGQAEYWLKNAVLFSNNAPEFEALLANFYEEQTQTAESLLAEMMADEPEAASTLEPTLTPENPREEGETRTE